MTTVDPTANKVNVRLYVIDMGTIVVKDVSHWSPGVDTGKKRSFACPAYLIRHPKGDLMWDTGLPDSYKAYKNGVDAPLMTSYLNETLTSKLHAIGVDPKQVRYLSFSHKHFDHIGNANLFVNATLVLQKEEYMSLFDQQLHPSVAAVKNNERILLDGDFDVFGDGTVIIKRTPGHTAGHQSLSVSLENTGVILLSGDLFHFQSNRESRRVPDFNENREETLLSMQKVESYLLERNATLWIQHDIDQKKSIRHSPEYYD